jgi:hypothetical protein
MPTAPERVPNAETIRSDVSQSGVVVVDLGKRKRKDIKKLREGTGNLMEDVRATIAELRSKGTLSANAEPVVLIVQKKRRTPKFWF